MTRPRSIRFLALSLLLVADHALAAPAPAADPNAADAKGNKRHRFHPRRGAATLVPPAAAPVVLKGPAPVPVALEGLHLPNGIELPPIEKAATDCPDRIPPGKKFKWDLRGEVELKDLVTWASATLCKPVILPSNLHQQKVQIFAPATITQPEAYRMFLAALTSMGLTIQPEGNAFIVIESNRAKESNVPFVGPDGHLPENAAFVTKLIRVQNVPVEDVVNVLNRLKSKDGDIVPYPPTLSLIITDVAENIRRMDSIVKMIDLPNNGERIFFVKLRASTAQEMSTVLEKIFVPKAGTSNAANSRRGPSANGAAAGQTATTSEGPQEAPPLIIADERANMLVILATERKYQQMLALIKTLENSSAAPLVDAADRVHIYALANANAEDIAATLSGLGVGVSSKGKAAVTPTPAKPGTPGAAAVNLFEGDVRVASDKPTNSLVIVAAGKDYYTLRDIIKKLDIARRQVYIEATILEVSLDDSRKLGAAFHLGGPVLSGTNQSLLFGGSEPNSSTNSIAFSPATLSGLAAGLRGPSIPGADTLLGLPAGTSVPAFGVYVQALQNNNDVNVVSMPHILTSDNEKANIEVGQNLPFPGSLGNPLAALGGTTAASPLGGLGLGTSVQRQDVSLKLEITPHVNDSDYVRLEIENEISDVAATNYNGLGPATNKRKVKTVVVVRDQQPVVLGGLVRDKISEAVDKVPLLGDIPIIGYLFKYTDRQVTKQNLLIIITPYVIKDPSDLRRIFERKVRERREYLELNSAFHDANNYEPAMDYRHKRGLLEEINRTALEAEREALDLRIADEKARGRVTEGPVDPAPYVAPASILLPVDSASGSRRGHRGDASFRAAPESSTYSPPIAPIENPAVNDGAPPPVFVEPSGGAPAAAPAAAPAPAAPSGANE